MSDDKSGWPDYPANLANPGTELAPLAPLAVDGEPAARDAQGRFLTGNNGGGRKRGSRNRLTDTFLAAIETDFSQHGPDALAQLRTQTISHGHSTVAMAAEFARDCRAKRLVMNHFSAR